MNLHKMAHELCMQSHLQKSNLCHATEKRGTNRKWKEMLTFEHMFYSVVYWSEDILMGKNSCQTSLFIDSVEQDKETTWKSFKKWTKATWFIVVYCIYLSDKDAIVFEVGFYDLLIEGFGVKVIAGSIGSGRSPTITSNFSSVFSSSSLQSH